MIPNTTAQPRRSVLPVAALLTLLLLAGFVVPATADASSTMVVACGNVSLRTGAKTSATRKALIPAGTPVRAVSTVDGGSYSASCGGSTVSGSKWLKIDAVNGKTVSSLYGVSYVYAASKLFKAATTYATPPPAGTDSKGAALMRLVSADRKALGKSSLAIDPSLVAIARNAPFACPTKSSLSITGRARDMAVRAYFSHDIKGCRHSDGTAYRAREILAVLYGYTGSRSEIIHWNSAGTADTTYKVGCDSNGSNCKGGTITVSKTVATAQRNFMSSSTHRAVELSTTYDRFGCGSAKAPDSARVYYACLFTAGGPTVLAKPTPTPAPTPTPKLANASCSVNLRTKATTSATRKATIAPGTTVRVIATVTAGGSYSTECGGKDVSGKSWFKIDRVNGKSVSSLYGVSAVYGAAGLFRPASSTTAALPSESIGTVGQTAADSGEVADADADARRRIPPPPRHPLRPRLRRPARPRPLAHPVADPEPLAHPVAEPDAAHREGLHAHVQRDVLRPRLRPRRRPVAVRRAWPRRRGPGLCRDPRPLLPGHDAGHRGQLADPGAGAQRLRGEFDPPADDLRANRHVHDRRDLEDLPQGRASADLPDHEQRHDLEGRGDLSRRDDAPQRIDREELPDPAGPDIDPAAALLQAEQLRPLPRRVPDRRLDEGRRHQRAPARELSARRRPCRDAVDLARRGAQGTDGRRAVVRRAPPAAGCLDLRPLRRHALAGLPGRAARSDEHEQRHHRNGRQGRSRAARRSRTRSSTRPGAARRRTTRTPSCRPPGRRWPAP